MRPTKISTHDSRSTWSRKFIEATSHKEGLAKDRQTLLSFFCYASFIKISFYDHITNDTSSWLRVFWTLSAHMRNVALKETLLLLLHNLNKWTFICSWITKREGKNLQPENQLPNIKTRIWIKSVKMLLISFSKAIIRRCRVVSDEGSVASFAAASVGNTKLLEKIFFIVMKSTFFSSPKILWFPLVIINYMSSECSETASVCSRKRLNLRSPTSSSESLLKALGDHCWLALNVLSRFCHRFWIQIF